MKNAKLNFFAELVTFVVIGIFCGIILGFAFGNLIVFIVNHSIHSPDFSPLPVEIGAFLGMGAGAILGAIFGGLTVHRK
ncbi:MAG: hypothetical protein WC755_09105 [Candidatus Woesearchaeota archaeon]|jgi:ABC-type antimicrobial peptide transport system permease subunit